MCKKRTVTKAECRKFEKAFIKWQLVFGVPEYAVRVTQDAGDQYYATMSADSDACTCRLSFCNTVREDEDESWIDDAAKHEALHLLLNRLVDCAKDRWASESEIDREYERVVRILEGVVKG